MLRVRAAVGPSVALRADANRRWTLDQALCFGHAVQGAALQVDQCAQEIVSVLSLPNPPGLFSPQMLHIQAST